MPTVPAYLFTSREEIERVISQSGVNLRLNDLDPTDSELALNEFIYDATLTCEQYLQHYYEPVDLYNSYWVRRRASWLACYYLSQRRGNPGLLQVRYEQILDELISVSEGTLILPGLPTRSDFTPALSNMVVDERFFLNKLRVHPSLSTGGTSSRQELSPMIPFEWL